MKLLTSINDMLRMLQRPEGGDGEVRGYLSVVLRWVVESVAVAKGKEK